MMNTTTRKTTNKLGKGIASLLNDLPSMMPPEESLLNSENEGKGGLLLIKIDEIVANLKQPRCVFNDSSLNELALSIKENGVIQPLVVEKLNNTYHLISGERRLRASKIAGLKSVPVIFKRVTAKEKAIMALVENIQREDLNCVDQARSYLSLLSDYKMTQEELAKKIGKNRSSIANILRILKLPKEVIEILKDGKISLGHAKVLVQVSDDENECIALSGLVLDNGLSVRELEALVEKIKSNNNGRKASKKSNNSEVLNNMNKFRDEIEARTGFHCDLKANQTGKGKLVIKFESNEQFQDIYELLLK